MEQGGRITSVSLLIWMNWQYNSWHALADNRESLKKKRWKMQYAWKV